MTEDEEASGARTMVGCAWAVLAAGAIPAVMTWQLSGGGVEALGLVVWTLIVVLPIAAAHAVLLGMPLYLLLRLRWPLRWWSAALGGFVVAANPMALLSALSHPHISRGLLREIAELGFVGVAAGLAFWIVLRDPRSHRF